MTTAETRAGVLPVTAEVPASELRVAVLGVGMMGADHVARLHSRISGARVTAVSDAFAEKAEQVAVGVPGCRVIGDPPAAIADDGVDAVVVATPGQFHQEQALACIERGIPVLCEKPLTMDSESSLAVVRAEDEFAAHRPPARPGRVHAPLRPRVRPAARAARVRGDRRAAAGALRAPQCRRPAHLHQRDDDQRLGGARGRRRPVPARRGDRRRHRAPAEGHPARGRGPVRPAAGAVRDDERADRRRRVLRQHRVGYEVRTEVVAEDGSAMIGLDLGLVRHTGGPAGAERSAAIAPDFRQRFGRAYDIEFRRWVDAARRGGIDGPGAWDGYAAQAVCAAGVTALRTGRRTEVRLEQR